MPYRRMHAVVETEGYISDAAAAGLGEEDRNDIISLVAANPSIGVLLKGAGGARKFRFAAKGKGKSGGVRVVTYFGGDDIPVFLLNVFAKGQKDNLTMAERNAVKKELAVLAARYRGANDDDRR